MLRAMEKYRKHKNEASKISVFQAKEIGEVKVHPMLLNLIGEEETS